VKVLAYTSPARGHLFPVVPILDELARRGHAIALRTLATEVPRMRERGFATAPIAPAIEAIVHDDYLARTPPGQLKRAVAVFRARAEHEVADLRAAIEQERPDVLLVDANCLGASAVAGAHTGPWAQWLPFPLPLPSPGVPPFGPGLRPAAGPLGRLRDRMLGPLVLGPVARAYLPAVNAPRAVVGIPPLAGFADFFTAAPLLLYMTAEPLEYPRRDWPPSVRMVGPCSWDPPADPPSWLADVRRPLVLVSTSSEFQDDGRLAATALAALADEDVEVVATLPAAQAADLTVPPNARVEAFLPHSQILTRAACAITHGGAGATMKALAAGVPVCAVPFGRDQYEVARRVEVAGAGTRLRAQRLTAARLRAKVREAMAMQAGARRVAAGFAAAGGAPAAAGALEVLTQRPFDAADVALVVDDGGHVDEAVGR
jgi:UDP:flavonoid glycosyltransferase YjiC (YdhE family)